LHAGIAFAPWRVRSRSTGYPRELVTLDQMAGAIVRAVENPPPQGSRRIVEAPAIAGP
jgi:hypothetical protein